MLHVYEFEVFQDGGMFLAFPYDMEGGTQGHDYREACESAADWLKGEIEHLTMRGIAMEARIEEAPKAGRPKKHLEARSISPKPDT